MEQKFRLDQSGKIADDDSVYENLDLWHENDEYDKILNTIQSIPRKIWSNRLWFRFISALNNLKRFDEARTEIEKIKKYCQTPKDQASAAYMLGYIFYMEDQEFKALSLFKQVMQLDEERNLFDDCRDCEKYIRQHFTKLVQTISMLKEFFIEKEQSIPEEDKIELSAEQLPLMLSFLPSVRRLPVVEKTMQTTEPYFKYNSEEKEAVCEFLLKAYQIHDFNTLKKSAAKHFHVDNSYKDIMAYTLGRPHFDLNELDESGRLLWDCSMQYMEQIIEYIPHGGLAAWDISETIGLARHAYACDLIDENELSNLIYDCTAQILKKYTSWNEYLTALVSGGAYFMFIEDLNIKASVNFLNMIGKIYLKSPLFSYKWATSLPAPQQ